MSQPLQLPSRSTCGQDHPVDSRSPSDITEQGSAGPRSKRQRLAGPEFARRKRASTACQFCRQRKTKCDNVKPICGFCKYHQARCLYEGDTPLDEKVPYDEASQEIIERLDEIRQLLANSATAQRPPSIQPLLGINLEADSSQMTAGSGPLTTRIDDHSSTKPPYPAFRCESLLQWPVFNELVSGEGKQIGSFVLDSEQAPTQSIPTASMAPGHRSKIPIDQPGAAVLGRGIEEDEFVPLCHKFLAYFHPRSPIVDAEELIGNAKRASEHGLGWDSSSCIVLLACAIACYTVPWVDAIRCSGTEQDLILTADVSDSDKATANAYYLAAKKRIGLLGTSIPDIQCLFFGSVFEKYSMRPLQAWFYVQQACARLQAHLIGSGRRLWKTRESNSNRDYHLEQRLFWSCTKAESELALELGLPTSGLAEFAYPDSFPSPPATLGRVATEDAELGSLGEHSESEERGWYFYLAEISLRRTLNDTLHLLYSNGERDWVNNITLLVAQHDEQEKQVHLWRSYLPASLNFHDDQLAEHELSFYLQGRFLEWQQYTLRPFIYYALHQPPDGIIGSRVTNLAQKGIDTCTEMLSRYMHHHRHGGTWFVIRHIWSCAVLILAVVIRGGTILPPPNWPSLIERALKVMNRWSNEAADIEQMRILLLRLYDSIRVR